MHSYTITNAIDDRNVLRFHIDYFKPDVALKLGGDLHMHAVAKAILEKHDAATQERRFNAILATASINDAIQYYELFHELQAEQIALNDTYRPLNIACVFSPPAEGNKDIKQIQEDLPQEKADNSVEPNKKKEALTKIMADYNRQYNTNHKITEFDAYYQDVQQRIKNQKYANADYAHEHKIDVMIVVDMLLTGFDSKYLNTLYVDKNLKYHGLVQAFSRTNRILNDTKRHGNILDFRQQEEAVNDAIALFSGLNKDEARKIWLVDPAPIVMEQYKEAVANFAHFMDAQGLEAKPSEVDNLKGDEARGEFINTFKEIQRLKTQLSQYTDIKEEQADAIEALIPEEDFRSFRSVYLDTAKRLRSQQEKQGNDAPEVVQQLDFEFVLFSSALIDYDYIMGLLAAYTQNKPSKQKMTRAQLVNLLSSSANMLDEREDIISFINTLEEGKGLTEAEIREGYQQYKAEKSAGELNTMAEKHSLEAESLQAFVDKIIDRMVFDGERLTDLLAPLGLRWKERRLRELALMEDLIPLLKKRAEGREIAGLDVYE